MGFLKLGNRSKDFYDSHAIPTLDENMENLKGLRVGAATRSKGLGLFGLLLGLLGFLGLRVIRD